MSAGHYSIGSSKWPGLSKLIEEAAEVLQVAGKLIGSNGDPAHFDGSDLRVRLVEEMGDCLAAIQFVTECNGIDLLAIASRRREKLATFRRWHGEEQPSCTGVAALWCPVHGDCKCPQRDFGYDLNDENCPLHGSESSHAEQSS